MALNSLKNTVRQYLSSQHMFVDDDWLSGCVEFLSEENSDINGANIQSLAREQWLLNDLKDICPGSLPANLKNQAKTVLNGRFVLQINAAIDIGTPAYQQYLKLQKVNMENVDATTKFEDKISNHRMIKLYMTDGVQEITGIEYKPMRNISCDITPGCKVLLKGPIECRRGMLLLTEASVELLGGEVQEYAISNSLAGLLSSKLGLPITQGPDPNQTLSNPRNTDIPTPHTHMPPTIHTDSRPVARVTSLQLSEFNDEDIDLEQLETIEAQFVDNRTKRPQTDTTSNENKKLKTDPITIANRSENPITTQHNPVNRAEDYPDDNDLFFEDEDYLKEIEDTIEASENRPCSSRLQYTNEKTCSNVKLKYPAEPFVYIKQINDMIDSDKVGKVFKVKGQIIKLLSKLSVGKDGWSLKCTIVDGTGSIDVDFTSDVLSKLVGYTPQEMNQLKKQMATNPELKEKAVSALQKAKDNLQVLYCIIEITILEVPKITKLIPFDAGHVQQLNRRLDGL